MSKLFRCSFCGSETPELVEGPPGCLICHKCLKSGGVLGETGEHCAFCEQAIGAEKGIVRKRMVQVAMRGPGIIICDECLQSAGEVANGQRKSR